MMAVGKMEHKTTIFVDGIKMHFTELGQGPLVLFIHGLPEDSCRIYMRLVADQGYRVVAPDMRGYGDTTGAPICDPSKLSIFHLVSDLILLLDTIAPNEYKVFVVGQDWGIYVALHLCYYTLNRAFVILNDAFYQWGAVKIHVDGDDHSGGGRGFQDLDEIEAESKKIFTVEVHMNINRGDTDSSTMPVERIEHKIITTNGIKFHFAELGQGPLVLFIHGLPGSWYPWRHRMALAAARGYRAVAPDMRGYGDTTGAPIFDTTKLSMYQLVGELKLFVDAIEPNRDKVFVVGHDWGVYVAWHLCLYRLSGARTLVNLSDPWNPVMNPAEKAWSFYGDDHHYMRGFQEPGENIGAESKMVVAQDVLKNINHEPNASGSRLFPAPPAAPGTEALTAACPVLLVSPRQYKSWLARVPKDVALVVMNEDYSPANTINIHDIRPNVSKQDLLDYFSIFGVLKLILVNCFFFALLIWVLDWF